MRGELHHLLMHVFREMYQHNFKPPLRLPREEAGMKPYNLFMQSCEDAYRALDRLLPPMRRAPADDVFTIEKRFEFTAEQLQALAAPFFRSPLKDYLVNVPNPFGHLHRPEKQHDRTAYEKAVKQYNKEYDVVADDLTLPQQHFALTPLYHYADLFENITLKERIAFPRDLMMRHMLVVGPSGAGKTTLLSTFINDALDKASRDEASVFVMDSQNQLVRWIAESRRFAPGGDLEGKLVYLEPSREHPLALNIFDFKADHLQGLSIDDHDAAMRETAEMVKFFIESIVKTDTSGFMDGIINYCIRALEKIPDADINTFSALLSKGNFSALRDKYPALKELDATDTNFLSRDMFDGSYAPSLGSMRARLSAFMSDKIFTSMFTQRNAFDLFDLLSSSKVILVNAWEGRLHAAKEPFGRFFLAKLLQATQQRSLFPGKQQDVYVFIDEAQDYLKHHTGFTEMQQKVRKQNVSLNIATHELRDFDPPVEASLKRLAIQIWGKQQPIWNVALPNTEPFEVRVPPFSFETQPRVGKDEWEQVLQRMRERFCNAPPKRTEVVPPPSLDPVKW